MRGSMLVCISRSVFSLSFIVAAGLSFGVPRDILTHRDGTKIEGAIVEETAEKIVIRTEKYGELHYPKIDLVKIERGVDPEAQLTTATPTPPSYDYRIYIPEGPIDPERPPRPIPIAALIQKGITPPPLRRAADTAPRSESEQTAKATPAPVAQATPLQSPPPRETPQPAPTTLPRMAGATPAAPTPTMVIAFQPTPMTMQTPSPTFHVSPTPVVALTPAGTLVGPATPAFTPSPVLATPVATVPVQTLPATVAPVPTVVTTPFTAPTAVQAAAQPTSLATGSMSPANLADLFLAQPVATASSASYTAAGTPAAAGEPAMVTPVAGTETGAVLTVLSGKGSVRRASGTAVMARGANIVEGETLQTGPEDTLVVGAQGGLALALGPSSELKILKAYPGAGLDLALIRGSLWAVAASNAPDKLVTLSAAGCQIAPDPTDLQQGLQLKVDVGADGRLTVASLVGRLILSDSVSDAYLTVPAQSVATYTPGSRKLEERPELMEPIRRECDRIKTAVEQRTP